MSLDLITWEPIIDKVTTGGEIAGALEQAFTKTDLAITAVNALIEGTSTHPTTLYLSVVNNSGVNIPAGRAVRHNGATSDTVYITMAQADSFEHATVLGITTTDIPSGGSGEIVTLGVWSGNTTGYSTGVPLYLSSTTPGLLTDVAPDIITQVGGCLEASSTGQLVVSIVNLQTLPDTAGILTSLSAPTKSLTTTSSSLTGYVNDESFIATASTVSGTITLPYAGLYKMEVSACMSFESSVEARTLTLELVDSVSGVVKASCTTNLMKEATNQELTVHKLLRVTAGTTLVVKAKTSTNLDVTFNSLDFSAVSVNARY